MTIWKRLTNMKNISEQRENSGGNKKIISDKNPEEKKVRLLQLFGTLKIKEDAVILQRRWRDS